MSRAIWFHVALRTMSTTLHRLLRLGHAAVLHPLSLYEVDKRSRQCLVIDTAREHSLCKLRRTCNVLGAQFTIPREISPGPTSSVRGTIPARKSYCIAWDLKKPSS